MILLISDILVVWNAKRAFSRACNNLSLLNGRIVLLKTCLADVRLVYLSIHYAGQNAYEPQNFTVVC